MGDRESDGLDREGGSPSDPKFEAKRRKGQQKVRQCCVNSPSYSLELPRPHKKELKKGKRSVMKEAGSRLRKGGTKTGSANGEYGKQQLQ